MKTLLKLASISLALVSATLVSAQLTGTAPAFMELPVFVATDMGAAYEVRHGILTETGFIETEPAMRMTLNYGGVTKAQVEAVNGKCLYSWSTWNALAEQEPLLGVNMLANFRRSEDFYPWGGIGRNYIVEWFKRSNPYTSGIPETPRFVNISVRTNVEAGANVIPGLVIQGAAQKVLVRAVGPTLKIFGVPEVLANPKFTLYGVGKDGNPPPQIASNDDWSGEDVKAAFASTGAFALPEGSKDACTVVTLEPGLYTVVVSGGEGEFGEALVEVYAVPQE